MMNKYHKSFIQSFAAENIISVFSRYRGAAKEITESMAMLEAAKKLNKMLNDCYIIVVGDGCSPRTGLIFAYYTKAEVLSIDPNFNMSHWIDHVSKQTAMGFPPQRIRVENKRLEDCFLPVMPEKDIIVVWPHSHANMLSVKFMGKSVSFIALPCCVPIPAKLMRIPHIVYEDKDIESGKRFVHIWEDLKQ